MTAPHERWFRKADNDLVASRLLIEIENAPYDVICFHCQQAAEKYLKGYLIFRGVKFRKLHDLAYLLDLCTCQDETFQELEATHDVMNGYGVEARYPEDYDGDHNKSDARTALTEAERVAAFVRAKVGMP